MAKAMRYFVGTIKRETEKAVLVEYCYHVDVLDPDKEYLTTVWLPKSQIEVYADLSNCVAYKVPLWLCNKNGLTTIPKRIIDKLAKEVAARA